MVPGDRLKVEEARCQACHGSAESCLNQTTEATPELLSKDSAPVRPWPHASRGVRRPSDQENAPNWSLSLPPFRFPGISCLIGPKRGSRVCKHLSSLSFVLRTTEPEHSNLRLKRSKSSARSSRQGLDRAVWAEAPAHTSIKHVMASVGPRVGLGRARGPQGTLLPALPPVSLTTFCSGTPRNLRILFIIFLYWLCRVFIKTCRFSISESRLFLGCSPRASHCSV